MADVSKGGDPMNDLFLFLGIFIVFFFIWVAIGGPQKPSILPFVSLETDAEIKNQTGLDAARQNQVSARERVFMRDTIGDLEEQLSNLEEEIEEARLKETASPFDGMAYIASFSGAEESLAQEEYIVVEAELSNDIDLPLSGWRLESVVTGNYAIIGKSAELPITGRVNVQTPILLPPGGRAIVTTGSSPIGTSFRINKCSGYFEQFQNFKPELSLSCPDPAEEFDDFFKENSVTTLDKNEEAYDICRDFVWSIPQCSLYRKDLREVKPRLHEACQSFVRTTLSYQGCLSGHRFDSDFYQDEWHVYIGNRGELWRDNREIIRLLDNQGRTVDVFTY